MTKKIITEIGAEILNDDGFLAIDDLIKLAKQYKIDGATHLSIDRYYIEDEKGIDRRNFSFQFVKRSNDETK